jgi:hypothetical protein
VALHLAVALAAAAGFVTWALAGPGAGEELDLGPATFLLAMALIQALPFLALAALSRLLSTPGQLVVLALAVAGLLIADVHTARALSDDPLQFLGFAFFPGLVAAGVLTGALVDALGRWAAGRAGRARRGDRRAGSGAG